MFYFDAHCDTLSAGLGLWDNNGEFDVRRAAARGEGAQLMAAYGKGQLAQLDRLNAEMTSINPSNRFTLLPAVEGGDSVQTLADLDEFLTRGVVSFGLTWNYDNALAGGCLGGGGGLTELGFRAVALFEQKSVCTDLAHASVRTFYDVLDAAKKPVLVSHACCAAIRPHPRNLGDDQLRALAKNGGLLAIAFHTPFLTAASQATTEDVAAHILHACRIMGSEHVAIGSDFDGGITAPADLQGTQDVPRLMERLPLPPSDIRAVAGGNLAGLFGL